MWIPLSLVALGIIARGSAFAFRRVVDEVWLQRVFGDSFAASSVVTPFFLGTVAGGVASGRVRPGLAQGNLITSWVNPTSLSCGVLAVSVCAYLSAIYLTAEARRAQQTELAEYFRRCSLLIGVAAGVVALATLAVIHADAASLFRDLTHRGLVLVLISIVAGLVSLALVLARSYLLVRVTAASAVAAVLRAWSYSQYPHPLPDLTITQAAATHATLQGGRRQLDRGASGAPALNSVAVHPVPAHSPHHASEQQHRNLIQSQRCHLTVSRIARTTVASRRVASRLLPDYPVNSRVTHNGFSVPFSPSRHRKRAT
jgi:hypothetical protein